MDYVGEKYLPLGSVVKLKGAKKCLMIIGYLPVSENEPDKIMDYNSCTFPEGVVSSNYNFLFNHEQIEEVLFKGFINDETKNFNDLILNFSKKFTESDDIPILAQQPNVTIENNSDIETL